MAVEAPEMPLMKAGAQPTLIGTLAERYGVDASGFYNTIIATVFTAGKAKPGSEPKPGKGLAPTKEMVMTFLLVANQYDLNPFLKEIYPFIDGEGNLKVVIGIDGWIKTALRNKQYDGHEFFEHLDADKSLMAVTCKIFVKGRTNPIQMTEYMSECRRDTDPWKQWPYRMLHHKAFIQTARYALGMGDLTDEDELDRLKSVQGASHSLEEPRRLSEKSSSNVEPARGPRQDLETPAQSTVPTASASPASLGPDELKRIWDLGFKKSLGKVDMNAMAKQKFGVDKVQELTKLQAEELIKDIAAL
jgi:phage recombination protein Bet